jgi:hypothetical protein
MLNEVVKGLSLVPAVDIEFFGTGYGRMLLVEGRNYIGVDNMRHALHILLKETEFEHYYKYNVLFVKATIKHEDKGCLALDCSVCEETTCQYKG